MKLIAALLTLNLVLPFAHAEEPAVAPANTPIEKENLKETSKKRLRHVGKNVENLGKKAGKKLGIKNASEPEAAPVPEHPAPAASPAHSGN